MLLCKVNDFAAKTALDSPYHERCNRRTLGRVPLAVPRVSSHRKASTVDFSLKAHANLQFVFKIFLVSIKR